MRNITRLTILFFYLFAFESLGKDELTSSNAEIEVITVTGKRPLNFYRQQIKIEQKKFYELYNSLVSENKFKIKCSYVQHQLLTRGRERKCQPNYMKKKPLEQSYYFAGRYYSGTIKKYKKRTEQDKQESLDELEELVEKNPNLAKQIKTLLSAKEIFKNKHTEYFK